MESGCRKIQPASDEGADLVVGIRLDLAQFASQNVLSKLKLFCSLVACYTSGKASDGNKCPQR